MVSRIEAVNLVDGDRQRDYGEPLDNMRRIALAWSSILDCDVSGHQVALCMAALKLVRESHRHKQDNIVDAHGYIDIANRVAQ